MTENTRKTIDAVSAARIALRDAMTKLDEACYMLSIEGCETTKNELARQSDTIFSADAAIRKAGDEYHKECVTT